MATENPPVPQQGFDEVLGALKQIVERLENGQLSLEAALAAFEEGVKLARQGAHILDSAERRVEILMRGDGPSPATGDGDAVQSRVEAFETK